MNMVCIEDNKNNMVIKHKHLIWEARYKLSELGIKVVAVLISMINVNDEDFKPYTLKINDFKELIHSNSNNIYKYVDILTDELMSKPFKIGDEKFNWIHYAKYQKGDNFITVKISPELKPYLLALQGDFIKYNIINILPLKSNYIIRLYELFKSKFSEYKHYHKKSKSYTFDLKIDWLREHLEIPNNYQYSSHIKTRIIEKAQKQFKAKTDIQFDYEEKKIGRKVDRLLITIKDNGKGSNDHLATIQSFTAYIRDKYKPDITNNVFPTIQKTFEGDIRIDNKGKLYLSCEGEIRDYDNSQSQKLWNWLYDLAKDGTEF